MKYKILKKSWQEKIKEIKEKSLDDKSCYEINMLFLDDIDCLDDNEENILIKMMELRNELKFALEIANMNFKKENLSFLKRLKKWRIKLGNKFENEVELK